MWVKPVSNDERNVFCTLCQREFAISHGGKNDIVRHENSDVPKKAVLAKGASNITTFFTSSMAEKYKIAASEVTYVLYIIPSNTASATTAQTAL